MAARSPHRARRYRNPTPRKRSSSARTMHATRRSPTSAGATARTPWKCQDAPTTADCAHATPAKSAALMAKPRPSSRERRPFVGSPSVVSDAPSRRSRAADRIRSAPAMMPLASAIETTGCEIPPRPLSNPAMKMPRVMATAAPRTKPRSSRARRIKGLLARGASLRCVIPRAGHRLRDRDGHDLALGGDRSACLDGHGHDDLAPPRLRDPGPQQQLLTERGGLQVLHVERGRDVAERRLLADRSALRALDVGGGRRHRMAVDEGRDQPAVDEAGHGHVVRLRRERRYDLPVRPRALEVESPGVRRAAAVAVREARRIVVLDGTRHGHGSYPRLGCDGMALEGSRKHAHAQPKSVRTRKG